MDAVQTRNAIPINLAASFQRRSASSWSCAGDGISTEISDQDSPTVVAWRSWQRALYAPGSGRELSGPLNKWIDVLAQCPNASGRKCISKTALLIFMITWPNSAMQSKGGRPISVSQRWLQPGVVASCSVFSFRASSTRCKRRSMRGW